jgi:hypothetical protein
MRPSAVPNRVLQVLTAMEFPAVAKDRCTLCAGFGVGPNGETAKAHTASCPVPKMKLLIAEIGVYLQRCEDKPARDLVRRMAEINGAV